VGAGPAVVGLVLVEFASWVVSASSQFAATWCQHSLVTRILRSVWIGTLMGKVWCQDLAQSATVANAATHVLLGVFGVQC
jgi:hypothetical protein